MNYQAEKKPRFLGDEVVMLHCKNVFKFKAGHCFDSTVLVLDEGGILLINHGCNQAQQTLNIKASTILLYQCAHIMPKCTSIIRF